MMKKVLLAALLAVWVAGCADSVITNLTPTQMPKNPTGQYLVEMQLNTQQQTMREESITPYVIVNLNEYKMRPVQKMMNRWETYIPISSTQDSILYHYKVNYQYNRFGKPGSGSLLSPEYKLTIK